MARRHQLRSFVGGVAEHHALVAGAAGVHALRDIARLLVDARDHRAGIGIEAVERVVVADRSNHPTDQALEIDVGLGRDLARDDHQAGRRQGFRRHAAVRILLQAGIENGVGDLVGNFVRVAFGNGFRGKQETVAQLQSSFPSRGFNVSAGVAMPFGMMPSTSRDGRHSSDVDRAAHPFGCGRTRAQTR